MVKTERDHTIYELEGDLQDLAAVENSELLDKKVVRRSTDAALILDDGLTIEEELTEYLLWILELPESTVKEVLKTYHDYI